MPNQIDYEKMIVFHGHSCPGLAMGYRMTMAALDRLGRECPVPDTELAAIAESKTCGIDALQFISGCTFGKGNLVLEEKGNSAYTFFHHSTGRGVRVVLNREAIPEAVKQDRRTFIEWLLAAPEQELLTIEPVTVSEPERARFGRG